MGACYVTIGSTAVRCRQLTRFNLLLEKTLTKKQNKKTSTKKNIDIVVDNLFRIANFGKFDFDMFIGAHLAL